MKYGREIKFTTPFLGTNIPGKYPVDNLITELLEKKIVGVANGRAEFGPRALGNRSLLADPRGKKIKDQVNEIKRRQKFRPFAPVILEEHVQISILTCLLINLHQDTCKWLQSVDTQKDILL